MGVTFRLHHIFGGSSNMLEFFKIEKKNSFSDFCLLEPKNFFGRWEAKTTFFFEKAHMFLGTCPVKRGGESILKRTFFFDLNKNFWEFFFGGRQKAGTPFFLKKAHIFFGDTPPVKKGGFGFDLKNSKFFGRWKAGTTEGGKDWMGERHEWYYLGPIQKPGYNIYIA